MGYRKWGP